MKPATFTLEDVCDTISALPLNAAVFGVEPDDRFVILAMSPSLQQMYGVRDGVSLGKAVDEFAFSESTRRRLKAAYKKCRDVKAEVTLDEEIQSMDGSRLWTSRTIVPLIDEQGEVIALVSTVMDITDLVRTRRALVRSLSATASGFVTICAWCRNVKDKGDWIALDNYVAEHSDADVVLCPDCRSTGEA